MHATQPTHTIPTTPAAAVRRGALALGVLALAVAARDARAQARAAPSPVTGEVAAQRTAQLSFATEFSDVAGDSAPGVWTGALGGEPGSTLTLWVASLGSAAAAGEPVWPVRTRWVVAHADPARSFVAELFGVVDWPTRRLRASGTVVDGWMRGAAVTAEGSMEALDAAGTLHVYPVAAGR